MTKLAISLLGTMLLEKNAGLFTRKIPVKETLDATHHTIHIPKGSGKTLGMLGLGGALGWKANEAAQDMSMGQQIRRQQGM
jgi:hypothetical protein